jgi:hypothetical protein
VNYLNDQQSVIITSEPNGVPEIEKSLGPLLHKIEEINQQSLEEYDSYGNNDQAINEDFMPDQPVDEWGNPYQGEMYNEEPQEFPPPGHPQEAKRPPKKQKNKKTIPTTSGYAHRHKEEKEKLERHFAAKEAMLQEEIRQKELQNQFIKKNYQLQLESRELDEKISEVSEVIIDAQKNQDHPNALKGTMLLTKFVQHQEDIEKDLKSINNAIEDSNQEIAEEEPDQVEVYLRDRFDPREAASPYFTEFLKNYPVCNPYDEEFDQELAEEIWDIRKQEARKLKIKNQGDLIGSDSYFRDIDSKINERYLGNEKKKQSQKSYKQAPSVDPEEDGEQFDDFQQYPEGGDNMNFDEKNSVAVPMAWGEHYDEGYAPTRGVKSSDYRDSGTGGYVGGNGMPLGGGGQYNPNHQRGPNGQRYQAPPPMQRQQGPYGPTQGGPYGPNQSYGPNQNGYGPQQSYRGGGNVQPVNRGDYRNNPNNARVPLDPVFRDQIRKMSNVMVGMVYPDGTQMNPQEREQVYIDWFSNPVNRKNL